MQSIDCRKNATASKVPKRFWKNQFDLIHPETASIVVFLRKRAQFQRQM